MGIRAKQHVTWSGQKPHSGGAEFGYFISGWGGATNAALNVAACDVSTGAPAPAGRLSRYTAAIHMRMCR